MKPVSVLIVGLHLTLAGTAAAQDSLNCRFEGNWPFGPSFAVAFDSSRNLAFCGSGGGVYVLDVSDSSQPVKLSEAIHTREAVQGLCYDANRLYVADSTAGLYVWDVTAPASPVLLGRFPPPDSGYSARSVAVAGSYAYVANRDSGFSVIDASDPTNLQEVGHCHTPDCPCCVAVAGNYAYVADHGAGLRVIDVSNPQSPLEVGRLGTTGYARGVAASGDHACVACSDSLVVIDVSNPLSPLKAGACATSVGTPRAVAFAGNCAYVAVSDIFSGLSAVDVSDPTNPREVGYYEHPESPVGLSPAVAASGNRAYLIGDVFGMTVIDITQPDSLSVLGTWRIPGPAKSVAVSGSHAYVGEGYVPAGLSVIDVTNPQDPRKSDAWTWGSWATRRTTWPPSGPTST